MSNENFGFVEGMFEGISRAVELKKKGEKEEYKVFDWKKAEKILEEKGWPDAEAGLISDWDYTGGEIVKDKKKVHDSYTYLCSFWATPALLINGKYIDCWCYKEDSPGWDADTKWPTNIG